MIYQYYKIILSIHNWIANYLCKYVINYLFIQTCVKKFSSLPTAQIQSSVIWSLKWAENFSAHPHKIIKLCFLFIYIFIKLFIHMVWWSPMTWNWQLLWSVDFFVTLLISPNTLCPVLSFFFINRANFKMIMKLFICGWQNHRN